MEISRIRALRGPNLWSRHTSIEAIVACTPDECALDSLPGFVDRLRERFPEIGHILRNSGTEVRPLADVLRIAALGLQVSAGCTLTFSRTAKTIEEGVYQVVVEYSEEAVGRLAFDLAEKLCVAALNDTPFDLDGALKELRDLDEDERLGPSTGSLVDAAVARGIPYRRLTGGSLVQFGWGSRQRRIQAAEMDCTSAIAESIAQDKDLTKLLLRSAGVPVPMGRPVKDAEDACLAAEEFGYPVVVKPLDGNQGKGVVVNLKNREELLAGFAVAREFGRHILLERYLPGQDYRFLVVGNQLVAAARRDPAHVIGDGEKTIAELVAEINLDPRRGEGHATSLTKIRLDDVARATLEKKGYAPDSIPPRGERVVLRNNANLSTGGTATDVTDDVHPDMAARAVDAARMVGLDICGIDVVCETVLKPLEAQGGGIVEVNAAPGLRMHLQPSFGKGRNVGEVVISNMFAPGENGRIPIVAVAGTNGKTTTARLIGRLFEGMGKRVGMTSTDGVYISGKRIDSGDCSGPKSSRNVLFHPNVDAAVFETARGGVLREGLGFDVCDVAVITNIGMGDHLGLNYIMTVEELAVVKRVIVQNVAPHGYGVLNAADPNVAIMADVCPGGVIFFARDRNHSVIAMRRAQGRRVLFVEGNEILAVEGDFCERIDLNEVPLTRKGTIAFQIENVMAATGAAWALGMNWETIRDVLRSFVSDAATAPGRFNVFDYKGATLIADYGHNPDAIAALVQAVEEMPARRRSVVISGAGDRRDEDIRQQTQILGAAFDDVWLYQDACQRGRADGEVVGLLREGLAGAARTRFVEEIRGEFLAIDQALAKLEAGDLCLILVDQVEEALAHIANHVSNA
ncbi:MAG: cyanophycin synthetase [Pseudomonadota bacterium]